jgi:hypothetical protein
MDPGRFNNILTGSGKEPSISRGAYPFSMLVAILT